MSHFADQKTNPFSSWPLSFGFFSTYTRPPTFPFFHAHQIHSAEAVRITPDLTQVLDQKADGVYFLFSDWQKQNEPLLAVKTADCLPICLIGKNGVGMVHAGWRGIEKRAWLAVAEILPYEAFIGPHICVDHYPVGDEFLDIFGKVASLGNRQGKLHFNLAQEAMARLTQDFKGIKIASADICTFEQSALHSFRRQSGTGSLYHVWHKNVTIQATK